MASRSLSSSDSLLWRIESDPVLRSPIVVVGTLDRPPVRSQVRAALERTIEALPEFRARIEGGSGGCRWVPDPAFHLEHHLRWARATAPGLDGLLAVAEADAADAFEPTRAQWTFTVVEDDAGGAGFVLRFHHAITDGVGAVGLADHLFTSSRRGGRTATSGPAAPPAPVRRASTVDAVASAATEVVASMIDPIGTAQRTYRFGRSLAHMLGPAPEPLSPIWRGRGTERRMHVLDIPFADLERAAAAAAGTVNDVHLGAVAGAAWAYHDAFGAPVPSLRFTVPINLRTAEDDEGGNHFAPARFVLPVDDPDPVHRARLAGAVVRRWRHEPALASAGGLAGLLGLLPSPLLVRVFGGMLRGIDLDVVDVPGLRRAAYLGGAQVERLWAFAPPAGAAASVTLLSHGAEACIGLACDTAAIEEPDLFADELRAAYRAAIGTGRRAGQREEVPA